MQSSSPNEEKQALSALRAEYEILSVQRDIWREVVASKKKILEDEKLKLEKLTDELIANREKFVQNMETVLDNQLLSASLRCCYDIDKKDWLSE